MARKTTKTSKRTSTSRSRSKPSSKSKTSASKSAPARKRTPARRTTSARGKKPGERKTSAKAPPSRGRRKLRIPRLSQSPRPVRAGISLDRKLDIIGVVLTVVGFLIALSLLSPVSSTASLRQVFGLGAYLFPFGLVLCGLWLVLRNFERIPQLAVERMVGIVLLFVNLLAFLHFFGMLGKDVDALDLAKSGQGGGYLGALVFKASDTILGMGGTAIALIAWLIVALALSLDVTIVEMARRIAPAFARLQDAVIEWWDSAHEGRVQSDQQAPVFPVYTPPSESAAPQGLPVPESLPAYRPDFGLQDRPRAWVLPAVENILDAGGEANYDDEVDLQRARVIEETLVSFGAPARVVEINRGPTITQFGVEPDFIESRGGRMRVRVGKITALADDLALALSARTIRIQAPVPGKGYVGIEVPNDEIALVVLRDVIESEAFKRLKSPLRFTLGQNVAGNAMAADLAAMPHLLIAGATGSGKSVCVNALISCLLLHNTPDDLRLVMIDPKRVELTNYNGIPHLLTPVVVELERVISSLQWVTREMDMRYRKLAEAGCRNVQEYNARQAAREERKLPYLVVIVDELADLMMLAPDETERTVTRLAQLARATGIHLVIATQRPSVDVVTGLIKANFPARIAFAVASGVDSRVILDQPGAERLLGRGDMLFQSPDAPAPVRLQGVFVSDSEIQRLVYYWQQFTGAIQPAPTAVGGIVDALPPGIPLKQMPMWEELEPEEDADPVLKDAIDLIRRQGRASISMLQRRLRIGYTRAARLIETMEEKGIVGPPDPSTGAREVLDYGPAAPPVDEV